MTDLIAGPAPPTGADANVAVGDGEESLTVLGLFQEMRRQALEYEQGSFDRAQRNEQAAHGDEFGGSDEAYAESFYGVDALQVAKRNHLRNARLTYSSRMLEDRPTVRAWPGEASAGDHAAADIANQIIDYHHQRQDIDALLMKACNLAQPHSCVAISPRWNPEGGPVKKVAARDEQGGLLLGDGQVPTVEALPQGCSEWRLFSIFNYMTDGSEEAEDSMWCGFRTFMDKYEARALCRQAGIEDPPPETEIPSAWTFKRKGVECWELFHIPCARIPAGLYAYIVGGNVVRAEPFPYEHGELPIAVWKIGERSDHPHGTTHFDDAVPIQRQINHDLTVARRIKRRFGEALRLLAPRTVIDQWSNDDQIIPIDDPVMLQYIRFIEPPVAIIKQLYEVVDKDTEALFGVFGVNEALQAGQPADPQQSGKAIAYLKELDSQKLAESNRSLGKALMRLWRQTLRLDQQYVSEPRMVQIVGTDKQLKTMFYRGADIAGVDVRLEPTSGAQRWRAQQAATSQARADAGLEDPTRAIWLAQSGLPQTPLDAQARGIIQNDIAQAMQGAQVQPNPQVPPQVAVEEISLAIEHAPPDGQMALQQLLLAYRQMMGGGQQPQGGGKPPEAPGQPETPAGLPMPPQGGF